MTKVTGFKKEKEVEYPIYEMEEKGSLVLPSSILSQVQFLHSHVGTTEWSGMLLYDVTKGDPSDPKNFELEAKHIFLMDIGTAGYTEYETDGDIVDIYDEIPEAMEMKLGHVHTHHSGNAYFSGTDMGELMDNVDKHNYYLSLVVCFNGSYVAKVVFLSDMHISSKMSYTDDQGKLQHFKKSTVEKHMVVINMKIYFSGVDNFFTDRLTAVKKKIEAAKKLVKSKPTFGNSNGNFQNSNFGKMLPQYFTPPVPDKMTNLEVLRLTENLLTSNVDLKEEKTTYTILQNIASEEDTMKDMYYAYMSDNVHNVIEAFFDGPLGIDELELVIGEVLMSIKRFEGYTQLTNVVVGIEGILGMILVMSRAEEEIEEGVIMDEPSNSIANQLAQMENEL